jgi:hypothetical protein
LPFGKVVRKWYCLKSRMPDDGSGGMNRSLINLLY